MNLFGFIPTLIIAFFLLFYVPMFAHMSVFFGAVMFVLGVASSTPKSSDMMWGGLVISLFALAVIGLQKLMKREP